MDAYGVNSYREVRLLHQMLGNNLSNPLCTLGESFSLHHRHISLLICRHVRRRWAWLDHADCSSLDDPCGKESWTKTQHFRDLQHLFWGALHLSLPLMMQRCAFSLIKFSGLLHSIVLMGSSTPSNSLSPLSFRFSPLSWFQHSHSSDTIHTETRLLCL